MSLNPSPGVVLVTSAGSDSARELIECLAPLRHRLRVVGINLLPDWPSLFLCDVAYLVPPTADQARYRPRLEEIIAREAPTLVFAGRDEDLSVLAALAEEERYQAIRILGPPTPLVPVCNDKLATARFAAEHGLPFAETEVEAAGVWSLVERHGLPIVAKPRWIGHASKDVYMLTQADQVRAALAAGSFVFQELLATELLARSMTQWRPDLGVPMSWALEDEVDTINLAIGRDGQVLRAMVTASERKGGSMSRSRAEERPEVTKITNAFAAAMAAQGYRGSLNIQGKTLPGRGFVIFEINGRVAGSASARALAGFNLPATLASHYLWDEPFIGEAAALPLSETPIVCRMLSSHTIPRHALATLRETGRWSRDGG